MSDDVSARQIDGSSKDGTLLGEKRQRYKCKIYSDLLPALKCEGSAAGLLVSSGNRCNQQL
jgi:hypothetical protein